MRNWRLHLLWSAAMVVALGTWGRVSRPRPEPVVVVQERVVEKLVEVSVSALPSRVEAAPIALEPFSEADRIRAMFLPPPGQMHLSGALSSIQDPRLKLALIKEALAHPNPYTRHHAVRGLESMKGPEAAGLLEDAQRIEKEAWLRSNMIRVLAAIGDPVSLNCLLDVYRTEAEDLRLLAAGALARIGHPGPAAEMLRSFAARIESPDGGVRRQVMESVAALGVRDARALLARGLRDTNSDVRLEAIYGLGAMEDPSVIPLLEPLLDDPNSDVATEAKSAIDELKP